MKAVILAGGKGTRLAPYTTIFPKPLMPLGEKPILETIITQLKRHGFKEIVLAVGYLSELIKAYFDDGSSLGINIRYSREKEPLGTVGPLNLIDGLDSTFLVMNGDILTTLSYSGLIEYHKAKGGIATIAVSQREQQIDYGVITIDNDNSITKYDEKPCFHYDVSMGIYVFEPEVLEYIPNNERMDLPELVIKLIESGEKVVGYPSGDKWLDIGRHEDYEIAQNAFESMRHLY